MGKLTCFRFLLFGLVLLVSPFAFAQKEANIWHFGIKAGIDFNSNPPRALYGGLTNSFYGHASMADSAGNLLFYVNGGVSYPGSRVYDRRHVPMLNNGFGFNAGTFSGAENALVVPWPGQPKKYFLFCDDPNSEVYSVIDMSLNNGFGNLATKNNFLRANLSTDVLGIKHKNNRDFWVIFQENQPDIFYSYLVAPSGLDLSPIVSQVNGLASSNGNNETIIKASPDGSTIAFTDKLVQTSKGNITLLNFNNATGQLSFRGIIPDTLAVALEFSPDGTKLYCLRSNIIRVGFQIRYRLDLVQYDLTAGSPANIFAGGITIFQSPLSPFNGNLMQVGPDGRIYITNAANDKYLQVINRPDLRGAACQFNFLGLDLDPLNTGLVHGIGVLPSFIQGYFYRPKATIRQTCSRDTAFFSLANTTNVDSINWNFDDPGSGNMNTSSAFEPHHFYGSSGNYTVQAIVHYNNYSDTIYRAISIPPALAKPNLGPDQILCPGDTLELNAFQAGVSYRWQDSLTRGPVFKVTGPGTYWVQVSNGCNEKSDTIQVTVKQPLTRFQDTTLCASDNFTLRAPAGLRYRWNTADTTRQITITKAGNYKVKVETIPGCFFQDSLTVKVERCFKTAFIPNIITPNHDNRNDRFEPKRLEPGTWDLTIYNRWGSQVYKNANYVNQWPETSISHGTYYYLLRHKTSGKLHKGWVEIAR